jgi:hypothetical protein
MIDRYLHAARYDRHAEEYAHEVANQRAAPSWGRVLDDCHVRSPLAAGIASESGTRGYSFRSWSFAAAGRLVALYSSRSGRQVEPARHEIVVDLSREIEARMH